MTPQQRAARYKEYRDVDSVTDFGYTSPPKGRLKRAIRRLSESVRKRLDRLEAAEQLREAEEP